MSVLCDLGYQVVVGNPIIFWSAGGLSGSTTQTLINDSSLGLSVNDSTGTGSGSVAWNYQISDSALGFLQPGQTLTEIYTVNVTDSQGKSAPEQVVVTVNGDAAPVNSVPAAQTAVNGSLIFNTAHSDAITVSDADNVYLTETLSVSAGTLTLNGTTGLTFTAGDGTTDATMTFSGTQADINAALSGMTYNAGNGTFADTLSIVTDDGTHATTSTVGITVPSPVSSLAGASLDLLTASDSGTSHTDNITNVTLPVITVNGLNNTAMSVGEKIEIIDTSNGNAVVGFYTVQPSDLNSGGWKSGALNITLTTALTPDGGHNLEALLVNAGVSGTSTPVLTVTEDTTAPTVTFTNDTLHSSSSDSFSGKISDNTTGSVTIQLFSGNSPGTIVGGASTSVSVTGGANPANWSISASTSLSGGSHAYVQATDAAGNVGISANRSLPAGVSGSPLNLALADYSDHSGLIAATITGLAAGWALSEGTHNADGSWSVLTSDIGSLTVTSPDGYVGALTLDVSETWTNADGTHGVATIPDNVEVYAKGSPVFAWSGDDTLTASVGNDTLVFANQIGTDVVHNFDTMHDKIDLVGFNGFASFADVQAHLGHDAAGNAVITLADGETITLNGVAAASLNAGDFEFNQTPVTYNTGDMVIGDGALLPLSGIVDNTGSIHLSSAGSETDLEIVQHGAMLEGGGTLVMSDNAENVIFGSDPSVTLTNVDNTISGAGHLGDGQMTLVNEGTIIADGTNALDIDTGSNAVVNSGTLEATGSGGLVVHSDLDNSGLLWANGGNITLDGDVSGNGSALISGNATLEVAGAFNGQVQFDDNASGTLKIDNAIDFHGMLSGFGNHDAIDLNNILASTASINYTANAGDTGGILTVTDGSNTANISLNGQYSSADFQIAADQTNHVLVQLEQHAHQLTAAA